MLTFVEILKNIASQPWSIEDPDILNIESLLEDSKKLILAAQSANSFIFRLNELPFKNYEQKFQTTPAQAEYESPVGNVQEVICGGSILKLDKDLSILPPAEGRPDKFDRRIVNAEDKIVLYPAPDNTYNVTVKYETFDTARRPQGDGYITVPNLAEDEDILNIPPQYENMYLECLYAKTMVYLIIDNTDENYQPYEKKFQECLSVLMKSSGLDYTKRIVIG